MKQAIVILLKDDENQGFAGLVCGLDCNKCDLGAPKDTQVDD